MNRQKPPLPSPCDDAGFRLQPDLAKPDFFLIGGAKCGTTSFAAYLPLHPQVAPWRVKEPNYWSWQRPTTAQYQDLFCNAEPLSTPSATQQIAGDYSTSSLLHPMVPRRVHAAVPGARIILMLRNPVDRAYSHYVMSRRSGQEEHQPFEEIVKKEMAAAPTLLEAHRRGFLHPSGESRHCYTDPDGHPLYFQLHNASWTQRPFRVDADLQAFYFTSYIFRSIYYDQVLRWLTLFPREQVMIIQSEKFFADPAHYMSQVAQFLKLQPHDFSLEEELQRHYAGSASGDWAPAEKYPRMNGRLRKTLREFFAPHNRQLYELVGEDYGWK